MAYMQIKLSIYLILSVFKPFYNYPSFATTLYVQILEEHYYSPFRKIKLGVYTSKHHLKVFWKRFIREVTGREKRRNILILVKNSMNIPFIYDVLFSSIVNPR